MRLPQIKTKAGQFTWLQVLALAVSGVAFLLNSMLTALVMLFIATLFGIGAMIYRIREAKQIVGQSARVRRRR